MARGGRGLRKAGPALFGIRVSTFVTAFGAASFIWLLGFIAAMSALADPAAGSMQTGTWYPAEPWYRTHKADVETWAAAVSPQSPDPNAAAWTLSSLALYHAARVVGTDAQKATWRSNANTIRNKLDGLLEARAKTDAPALEPDSIGDNYHSPFILLLLEHVAAGLPNSGTGGNIDDRDPIVRLAMADLRTRRIAIEIASLMMSRNQSDPQLKGTPIEQGVLARYAAWTDTDPGVTGNVVMGLQSAMKLRVLEGFGELERQHLEPKIGKGKAVTVKYEDFRNRWIDVLVHIVVQLSSKNEAVTYAASFDKIGQKAKHGRGITISFGKSEDLPIRWQTGFRNLERGGVFERQVAVFPSPHLPDSEDALCRIYNYGGNTNAYQTASGGYALLVSAQLLDQTLALLESEGEGSSPDKPVGDRCLISWEDKSGSPTWVGTYTLGSGANATNHPIVIQRGRPGHHVGITVSLDKSDLRVDQCVTQAVNSVVSMLYPSGDGTIAQGPSAYHNDATDDRTPYAAFAIGKFLVAAGFPNVVARFRWHDDLCNRIADSPNALYGRQFAILLATQAYRPIYPRSNEKH